MPEAVTGHSASPSPLSCGEIITSSATRRGLFGLVAAGALLAAVPALAANDPALVLFAEWCAVLRCKLPAHWSDRRKEAMIDRLGQRQDEIPLELAQLPATAAQTAAMLWVQAWEAGGGWLDPDCPPLPNVGTGLPRQSALSAARAEPRLAAIAWVQ